MLIAAPMGKDHDSLLTAARDFEGSEPAQFPDGERVEDAFPGYRFDGVTTYLQFRNRNLVNFEPSDFVEPVPIRVLRQSQPG